MHDTHDGRCGHTRIIGGLCDRQGQDGQVPGEGVQ